MKLFLEETELIEISPLENLPKDDNALIITPTVGIRGKDRSELSKEIIAIDAIELGPTRAAEIHGIPLSSAKNYANGKDMDEDTKSRVLATKFQVEDTAVMKLMDTLNLINPGEDDIKLTAKRAQIANALSQVVDRIGSREKKSGGVVLHLHMPNQKKEDDYTVIDV